MSRIIAAALVIASLAFSVGGVAVVGRAGSAQSSESDGQCKAPMPIDGRIAAGSIPPDRGATIVLNTRGYNYADPGVIQMNPLAREPSPAPQPPAAPAKP